MHGCAWLGLRRTTGSQGLRRVLVVQDSRQLRLAQGALVEAQQHAQRGQQRALHPRPDVLKGGLGRHWMTSRDGRLQRPPGQLGHLGLLSRGGEPVRGKPEGGTSQRRAAKQPAHRSGTRSLCWSPRRCSGSGCRFPPPAHAVGSRPPGHRLREDIIMSPIKTVVASTMFRFIQPNDDRCNESASSRKVNCFKIREETRNLACDEIQVASVFLAGGNLVGGPTRTAGPIKQVGAVNKLISL